VEAEAAELRALADRRREREQGTLRPPRLPCAADAGAHAARRCAAAEAAGKTSAAPSIPRATSGGAEP
jgi:hypothetical protein